MQRLRLSSPRGKIGLRVLGVFAAVMTIIGVGVGAWRLSRLAVKLQPPHLATVFVPRWKSVLDDDQKIGVPVGDAMRALPGVRGVECRTNGDGVLVTVTASPAAQGELPLEERVRTALEPVILPDGAGEPRIGTPVPGDRPAFWMMRLGDRPAWEAGEWARQDLLPALLRVPGVRDVTLCGPEAPRPAVELDAARLRAVGLAPAEVIQALSALRGEPQAVVPPVDGEGPQPPAPGTLLGLRLGENVRLSDVAVVEMVSPPAKCLAFQRGQQVAFAEGLIAPHAEPKSWTVNGPGHPLAASAPPGIDVVWWSNTAAIDLWLPSADLAKLEPLLKRPIDSPLLLDGPGRRRGAGTELELQLFFPLSARTIARLSLPAGVTFRGVRGAPGTRLVVSGSPPATLGAAVAAVVARFPKHSPAVAAVPPDRPTLEWQLDETALDRAGVSPEAAASMLALAAGGAQAGGVHVRLSGVETPEQLGDLELAPGVRLRDVASLRYGTAPAEVLRWNGEPAVEVYALGHKPEEAEAIVAGATLPAGITVHFEHIPSLYDEVK